MGNSLIKLARRNKSLHLLSPPIFILNGHCFDELFEYLSLKDLHSLGQTCKSMQRMTGEFFTRNYSGAKFYCLRNGIYLIDNDKFEVTFEKCTPVPGFMHLITWISIGHNKHLKSNRKLGYLRLYEERTTFCPTCTTHYSSDDLGIFKYIKLHAGKLKSIKKLTLTGVIINEQTVGYIREILPNIEELELMGCRFGHDFYDVLFQYCKDVRRIELSGESLEKEYGWLQRRYEKLEHLGLGDQYKGRIDELSTFLKLNPNVRSFSCDESTLLSNEDAFFNCKVKLDTFELVISHFENESLCDLLCRLHAHGFYKRLEIDSRTDLHCNQLSAMPFLEKRSIVYSKYSLVSVSNHLIEYAETGCADFCNSINQQKRNGKEWRAKTRNKIYVENLSNVEPLYLYRKDLDILFFIQKFKKLKKMKLFWFNSAEILQLEVLNEAREKLVGAQKVTIYVPDVVFLATKWATKNGTTNLSMIEMKRTHSYEWRRYLFCKRVLHFPPGMEKLETILSNYY